MYFVYILKSAKDEGFYTGVTENLEIRLMEHNSGKVTSTHSRIPPELCWYCAFQTKEPAFAFEKYLKSGSGYAFARKRLTV
jgi:putative endonuclease